MASLRHYLYDVAPTDWTAYTVAAMGLDWRWLPLTPLDFPALYGERCEWILRWCFGTIDAKEFCELQRWQLRQRPAAPQAKLGLLPPALVALPLARLLNTSASPGDVRRHPPEGAVLGYPQVHQDVFVEDQLQRLVSSGFKPYCCAAITFGSFENARRMLWLWRRSTQALLRLWLREVLEPR